MHLGITGCPSLKLFGLVTPSWWGCVFPGNGLRSTCFSVIGLSKIDSPILYGKILM